MYYSGVRRCFAHGERKTSALAHEVQLGATVPLWTHNCRVYWLQSLEDFTAEYLSRTDRAGWYEVIRAGKPCKLYMDIDGPPDLPDYAAFEAELLQTTERLLWEDHQYRPLRLEPYVLDATTERKFSRHYIWPVVWVNNKAVGAFVDKLKAALVHRYSEYIDTAVYTTDRNFRIWDSAKDGGRNPLKLVAPASALGLSEEAKLCRTLISAVRVDDSDSWLAEHVQVIYDVIGHEMPAAVIGAGIFKAAVPAHWDTLVSEARTWLERRTTTYRKITVKKMGDHDLSFNIQKSDIACPCKGRPHKNNGVWFDVNVLSRMMRFKCQDRECGHCVWSVSECPKHWTWPEVAAPSSRPSSPKRRRVVSVPAAPNRRSSLG